jgi:hypothetical protein
VALNLNGSELEVDPRPSNATTQRAIAQRSNLRCRRELQLDRAAVA